MSQEDVEVVRKPLRLRERSSRSFDQRLALRFPRLTDRYIRFIGGLPPMSRIRQVAVWRAVRDAVEAWNRRDLDAFLIAYHLDCEHYPPRELVEAGLWEHCYRGRDGYAKLMASWSDAGTDARVQPVELIDLGARVVMLSETLRSHVAPRRSAAHPSVRTCLRARGRQVAHPARTRRPRRGLEAVGLPQ
jgi:hypothetical protein